MSSKFRLPTSKILTFLVFLIIFYAFFSLSKIFWKSYKLKTEISSLEKEISQLEERKRELKNLITYYGTSSYKEKEARQRLGYQKPGEHVLIIMPEKTPSTVEEEEKLQEKLEKPNWQLWWEYFFK